MISWLVFFLMCFPVYTLEKHLCTMKFGVLFPCMNINHLTIFWCGKQNDRPYVTLAMPFNLILSIYPVFLMTMPVNMILVMYVILCILSFDFNKLTMLYIHVHISISMTNKSGLTFFLSIKYLSVCLSSVFTWDMWRNEFVHICIILFRLHELQV